MCDARLFATLAKLVVPSVPALALTPATNGTSLAQQPLDEPASLPRSHEVVEDAVRGLDAKDGHGGEVAAGLSGSLSPSSEAEPAEDTVAGSLDPRGMPALGRGAQGTALAALGVAGYPVAPVAREDSDAKKSGFILLPEPRKPYQQVTDWLVGVGADSSGAEDGVEKDLKDPLWPQLGSGPSAPSFVGVPCPRPRQYALLRG